MIKSTFLVHIIPWNQKTIKEKATKLIVTSRAKIKSRTSKKYFTNIQINMSMWIFKSYSISLIIQEMQKKKKKKKDVSLVDFRIGKDQELW